MDHVAIFRWVQRYAPEISKRMRPHLKMNGTSYRLDEMYVATRCIRSFHMTERMLEGIE